MTIAELVLFGILLSAPKSQPFKMECPSWTCVERVITEAHRSPALSRLRVFQGRAPGVLSSGETIFPPLLDLRFQ